MVKSILFSWKINLGKCKNILSWKIRVRRVIMTQKNKLQFLTHLEFQMRFDLLFEITSYLLHIFQGNKIHKYICNLSDGQIRIFLI